MPEDAYLAANYARFCFVKDDKVGAGRVGEGWGLVLCRRCRALWHLAAVTAAFFFQRQDLDAAAVRLQRLQELRPPTESAS